MICKPKINRNEMRKNSKCVNLKKWLQIRLRFRFTLKTLIYNILTICKPCKLNIIYK